MNNDNNTTKEEWKKKLTSDQYRVLIEKGTESPFSGGLLDEKKKGVFTCGACGADLFGSDTKYDSGSGWPSFWDAVNPDAVELKTDSTLGMGRTEVVCANCGGHLGHMFNDGPKDQTGQRYCINSLSLDFKESE